MRRMWIVDVEHITNSDEPERQSWAADYDKVDRFDIEEWVEGLLELAGCQDECVTRTFRMTGADHLREMRWEHPSGTITCRVGTLVEVTW